MNGYFQNDRSTGSFTCFTPCGKSLIDYLICDVSFYKCLETFEINPLNTYSDHRALMFSLMVYGNEGNQFNDKKKKGDKKKGLFPCAQF